MKKLKLTQFLLSALLLISVTYYNCALAIKIVIQPTPTPDEDSSYREYRGFDRYMRSVSHDYDWRPYEGFTPHDAIVGSAEGRRVIYICNAAYTDGVHPGRLLGRSCAIPWNGAEVQVNNNFKILLGKDIGWESYRRGRIPRNAVVGGFLRDTPLYICRAQYGRGLINGKIFQDTCYIGYEGKEIPIQYRFDILVSGRLFK